MFCHNCGASVNENSQYCSKCGTALIKQDVKELVERREFVIPIPSDSPFNIPFPQDGNNLLNFQQLRLLGIKRPEAGDYLPSRGYSHLWKYFSKYAKTRVDELKSEGWELDESFDPKDDIYGILTLDGIRQRFVIEEVSMPSGGLFMIKGFRFMMKRPLPLDKPTGDQSLKFTKESS